MKRLGQVWLLLLPWLLAAGCGGGDSRPAGAFFCPMHPAVVDDRISACPLCGMNLVPAGSPLSAAPEAPAAQSVAGRVAVHIPPERLQRIGFRTARVERQVLPRQLRLTGVVQVEESRRHLLTPRFSGQVEHLLRYAPGTRVEQGEILFRVYSPHLRATHVDLLEALRLNDARLQRSARSRLSRFGLGAAQIEALATRREPEDSFEFPAPAAGIIASASLAPGLAFAEGQTVMEILDLSRVIVHAAAPASDLPALRPGLTAALRSTAHPGRSFPATLTSLAPAFAPRTRTIPLRLAAENGDLALRAEEWVEVEIDLETRSALTAPSSALLDTGERVVAFVDHGDGDLEPRAVEVGWRGPEAWEILRGLDEGERVVTRARFLVDAESQFQAVLEAMTAPAAGEPNDPAP
jgi:Cu(I)/Ag(I) efflux system membrane fusion protein